MGFEAIKRFMDVEGAVFVVGVDPKVIERGIEIRYRSLRRRRPGDGASSEAMRDDLPISGARYIEKIVQLPFTLCARRCAPGAAGRCVQRWREGRPCAVPYAARSNVSLHWRQQK